MCAFFFSWKEFKTSKYVRWKILGKSNLCIFVVVVVTNHRQDFSFKRRF